MNENVSQFQCLIDEVIEPNMSQIERMWSGGNLAVVEYDKPADPAFPAEIAEKFGLNGTGEVKVQRLTRRGANALADRLPPDATSGESRWLCRNRQHRILVIVKDESFFLNYMPGKGFKLEPGTYGADWMDG